MQIEAVDDDETFKDVVVFIISHFLCCVCTGLYSYYCAAENFMYTNTRTRLSPPGNSHLYYGGLKKKKTTDF